MRADETEELGYRRTHVLSKTTNFFVGLISSASFIPSSLLTADDPSIS
jgi:hypothetical protein